MKQMQLTCTVTPVMKRGKKKWQVRWREEGRPIRRWFPSKEKADSKAALVRSQIVTASKEIQLQPQEDGQMFLAIQREAKARGLTLQQVLLMMPTNHHTPKPKPTLSVVLVEMEARKRKAGRASYYVNTLRQIIQRFARAQEPGQQDLPVDQYTVRHLEVFLDAKELASRSTLRSKLSTFFKYAVLRDYRTNNPCLKLESITRTKPQPKVFTLAQTVSCLQWLETHPRLTAWFVLSTFCGLRPEEAQKTKWSMINFEEGWIRVEAQTTKVRQRRVVNPLSEAMAWLKYAKKMNAELPLSTKQRTVERHELRDHLGWKAWPKDITRHTASSMWFAHTEDAASVAKSLGHEEAVMKKDYMALVTIKEAVKFWALRPPAVKNPFVKPKPFVPNKKKQPSTASSKSLSRATTIHRSALFPLHSAQPPPAAGLPRSVGTAAPPPETEPPASRPRHGRRRRNSAPEIPA